MIIFTLIMVLIIGSGVAYLWWLLAQFDKTMEKFYEDNKDKSV